MASVAVCDTAVPLSSVVDRMAIVEGTTKLNEDFMTILPKRTDIPSREHGITQLQFQLTKISEFGRVEQISAEDPPSTDRSLEAVALSAFFLPEAANPGHPRHGRHRRNPDMTRARTRDQGHRIEGTDEWLFG